jgi:hypothetical protein
MANKNTADLFFELVDYLGPLGEELGELIADAALGANIFDPETKRLLTELFASMPESDNLTLEDIATNLQRIDHPFAAAAGSDILTIATELD